MPHHQSIEIVPERGIMVVGAGIYKIMHDEFFGALRSKEFTGLRLFQVTGWGDDVEQIPFFKKRTSSDYLKLTVYLSNVISRDERINTHFSYLARRVQMELSQRWVRLLISRKSKSRTLAFCMAMHPRLGENSSARHMPPDAMRHVHVTQGLLKYIGGARI